MKRRLIAILMAGIMMLTTGCSANVSVDPDTGVVSIDGRPVNEIMKELDPEAAEAIHPNNIKRVVRALEYSLSTGRKISDHNREQRPRSSPYNFLFYVLTMDRAALYRRIDLRVDQMMEQGLLVFCLLL